MFLDLTILQRSKLLILKLLDVTLKRERGCRHVFVSVLTGFTCFTCHLFLCFPN